MNNSYGLLPMLCMMFASLGLLAASLGLLSYVSGCR